MKRPITYRVAPDKELERWYVLQEDKKLSHGKGWSREKAVRKAMKLAERKHGPVLVLVHKTRYIMGEHFLLPN